MAPSFFTIIGKRVAAIGRSCQRTLMCILIAMGLVSAPASFAAWSSTPEILQGHPTWIYTPSSAMPNGKHVLLIALHGCVQSHDEIKEFGNLAPTAEANGMVVAVPGVADKIFKGNPQAKCWDYDGAKNTAAIADVVNIANTLKARSSSNIDPAHVYVVGLSSGAAMALDVGCRAPDVFAGVGAIAGPSVGSNQNMALMEGSAIPQSNVDNAVSKCKSLAGTKASDLDTQITNVTYGDMDLNGPKERYRFTTLRSDAEKAARAGQIALVSVKWTQDNAKVLQKLYGAGDLGPAQSVQGGFGTQQEAKKDNKSRVSLLVMHDIGHAWAAGTGRPNSPPPDGIWMAQSGLNYPEYITGWLIANNLRAKAQQGMPVIDVNAKASGRTISIAGMAKDPDGSIARIDTALFKSVSGVLQQIDNHRGIAMSAGGSFTDSYADLADARYTVQVTATDNTNNTATAASDVQVGTPAPIACFTDSNFNHVQKARAVQCVGGFTCAKGSGDNLGLFNVFVRSSVIEDPPGFFKKGACNAL